MGYSIYSIHTVSRTMGLNLRQVWRMTLIGLVAALIPIGIAIYPTISSAWNVAIMLLYGN